MRTIMLIENVQGNKEAVCWNIFCPFFTLFKSVMKFFLRVEDSQFCCVWRWFGLFKSRKFFYMDNV
jgi:hypothetical protein